MLQNLNDFKWNTEYENLIHVWIYVCEVKSTSWITSTQDITVSKELQLLYSKRFFLCSNHSIISSFATMGLILKMFKKI